jgi:hypothetical protein
VVIEGAELRMRPLCAVAARNPLISVALDLALVAWIAGLPDALPVPAGGGEDVVDVGVRERHGGRGDGARLSVG